MLRVRTGSVASLPSLIRRICPALESATSSRPSGMKVIVAALVVEILATVVSVNPAGSAERGRRGSRGSNAHCDATEIMRLFITSPACCVPARNVIGIRHHVVDDSSGLDFPRADDRLRRNRFVGGVIALDLIHPAIALPLCFGNRSCVR